MNRFFIDANVFIYALGEAHRYRDACRDLVARLARGELAGETSVEVLQEVLHVRRRRGGEPREAVERVREILALGLVVHDVGPPDLELALELVASHPELPTRDAIHAATARERGIELILSSDRHFDQLESLERVDPAAPDALAKLGL